MVWSEQVGASIMVPSDRVAGDGRNYMIIGEDVPSQIAGDFTAALVFYSGKYDGTAATDFDIPGGGPLAGFVYYAIGISTAGNLEFVVYFFTTGSQSSDVYSYYRQTVLSLAAPTSVNSQPGFPNGPVLALGMDSGYDSYTEGPSTIVRIPGTVQGSNSPEDIAQYCVAPVAEHSTGFSNYIYRDPNGVVHLSMTLKNTGSASLATGTVLMQLPVKYRPARETPCTAVLQSAFTRIDVNADGTVTDFISAFGVGNYLSLNASWLAADVVSNIE